MLGMLEYWIAVPLLAVAAAYDVGSRRIPNVVNLMLFAAGGATSIVSAGLAGFAGSMGAALLTCAMLMLAWNRRTIGGGDLKLAVACAAWVGFDDLFSFAIASALAGGALAFVCGALSSAVVRREMASNMKLAALRAMPSVSIAQGNGRMSVPYGAGIAMAAAWVIFGS